jgi:2-dehydropantoate 2-reductase
VRIVILGAGAVGSLLGARLSVGAQSVVLVGRRAHVEAIRRDGLRIEGVGAGLFRPEAEEEIPAEPRPDAVVVTVKSFDLDAALQQLAGVLSPTPTLLTQNGLGIAAQARASLTKSGWTRPEAWLVRGVHSLPARWIAPGVIRATGSGEFLLPEPVGPPAAAIDQFRGLLAGAGIAVRLVASIDREEWRKAIVNAAINPVTAVRGVPNGTLASGPGRSEALTLLEEARTVARAEGFDFEQEEMEADFDRVVRATAENRSSMLQDVERGRPTEIDAISGEIVRRGTARGLDLPATRTIVAEVRRRTGSGRIAPQPS